ncbi:MAG: nitrite/sulfite reductase, partial [Myxococcales bacterium]
TSSRGLAALAGQALEAVGDTGGCNVKVSGCPNSCGQHHVSGIGFFGMARKLGGKPAPVYQMLLGGGLGKDGAKFGRMIAKIPARHAPAVVQAVLELYRSQRAEGEAFIEWARRVDPAVVEAHIKPLSFERAEATDEANFTDLGDSGRFSTGGTGAGECAA